LIEPSPLCSSFEVSLEKPLVLAVALPPAEKRKPPSHQAEYNFAGNGILKCNEMIKDRA
jgi:hypothetical protein